MHTDGLAPKTYATTQKGVPDSVGLSSPALYMYQRFETDPIPDSRPLRYQATSSDTLNLSEPANKPLVRPRLP